MSKMIIMICLAVFGLIGGFVPLLFGDNDIFSLWGILGSVVGGFIGIWIGVKISKRID